MGRIGQILAFVVILILDQATKYAASNSLLLGEPVSVIPGLFNLTLVYNPGAAFGMFGGYSDGVRRAALWSVSIVALIVVMRFMVKEASEDRVAQYALVGILSGALGNIIDRLRFDAVVDFLDFYWRQYHWPAFNVADSAISVGVAVLIFRVTFAKPAVASPAEIKAEQYPGSDAGSRLEGC